MLNRRTAEFLRTSRLLRRNELLAIYQQRQGVKPSSDQLKLILASMCREGCAGIKLRENDLGWYWFRNLSRAKLVGLLSELAEHRRPSVRWTAANLLGFMPRTASVKPLRRLISDPVGMVAEEAVKGLGRSSACHVLTMLHRMAADTTLPCQLRCEALIVLAAHGRAGDTRFLHRLLADPSPSIRSTTIRILPETTLGDIISRVRDLTTDPIQQVRYDAIRFLGKCHRPEDHQRLRELAGNETCLTRSSAVMALAEYRDARDLPLFRLLAVQGDFGARWHAAEALGNFGQPNDIPFLRRLVLDKQIGALDALLRFPPRSIGSTFRELLEHRDTWVRCNLTIALGDWRSPQAARLLRRLAHDDDPFIQSVAVSSLAALDDPRQLPFLRRLVNSNAPEVRREVVWALGHFRRAEDSKLLKGCFHDETAKVRTVAARAWSAFAPKTDLEELLTANNPALSFEVLKEVDYRLYAPAWLQIAEKRDEDDCSFLKLGIHRSGLEKSEG